MFSAKTVVTANNRSVALYLWLATTCGVEGADWIYEWSDGGRMTFAFRSEAHMECFRTKCSLLGV
jgi:hypothetical protein